jgi:hypothetical protein
VANILPHGVDCMSGESDDLIILKHTWSLARESIRLEFREILLGHSSMPSSIDAPYAAPIRIWQRMSQRDRAVFLDWIDKSLAVKS